MINIINIKKLDKKETTNVILCCNGCKTSTAEEWLMILLDRNILVLCKNCMDELIKKINKNT